MAMPAPYRGDSLEMPNGEHVAEVVASVDKMNHEAWHLVGTAGAGRV